MARLSDGFVSYKSSVTKSSDEGAKLKNIEWNIKALPAYVFITAKTLRERFDTPDMEQIPEVRRQLTECSLMWTECGLNVP